MASCTNGVVNCQKRRILMAIDGSQHADEAFKWYLKKVHMRGDYVIVVYIPEYKKLTHVPVMTSDAALMTRMVEEEQQQSKLLLARCNEMMKINSVEGNVKQLNGEPGEQIVNAANKEGADFIITGSRGLGKIRRTLMGSVSDYVVHHSNVPVLVCRFDEHGLQ